MKINFIVPFHKVTGGIRVVFELSNELINLGHQVNIIYPVIPVRIEQGWRGWLSIFIGAGKSLINRVNWFALNARLVKVPSISPRLVSLSEKFIPNADVTIATQRSTAYFVDKLSTKKGRKVYFIQHYEIWPLWADEECWTEARKINKLSPSIGMADVKPLNKKLADFKNYVDQSYRLNLNRIVTSTWESEIMKKLNVKTSGSIPYGVNFNMFNSKVKEVDSEKITILALYRNSSMRGDQECLEAFRELNLKYQHLNFLMFGEEANDSIPDFIKFFENPSQEKIRDFYREADIMVYAPWVEGYGMPPMEALACNTALISTDVGAVRDYSPEGFVKYIPIQDSNAIVKEVQDLIGKPDKIKEMKKKGLENISQFTWKNATLKFESLLSKMVE